MRGATQLRLRTSKMDIMVMVGRKSLWNLHCRLFLYLQAILGFWNRVLSDLIMPSFIGRNFTVDDVENTQSMLLWCKGLMAYSDFPFKGERQAGFRNMLICVLPFSPPETMNGSFQLELALRSTMAIERERERKKSWRDCSGHDTYPWTILYPFVP